MASPTSAAACDLLVADDFEDRNSLISFLVSGCGWSTVKVGHLFGLSDRQVRRIVRTEEARPRPEHEVEHLTSGEAKAMLRDYSSDPYATAEERELATSWVTSYTQANGLDTTRYSVDARHFTRDRSGRLGIKQEAPPRLRRAASCG